MARSWIVLTADRSPHAANEIIAYTEWDGYVALADEVVYTDPVDVDGNAVDGLWKVGGSVVLAAGVYTYSDSGLEPSLVDRQRGQISMPTCTGGSSGGPGIGRDSASIPGLTRPSPWTRPTSGRTIFSLWWTRQSTDYSRCRGRTRRRTFRRSSTTPR